MTQPLWTQAFNSLMTTSSKLSNHCSRAESDKTSQTNSNNKNNISNDRDSVKSNKIPRKSFWTYNERFTKKLQ